jgi:pimeloyl-ACP methyl ester carboxylesterase
MEKHMLKMRDGRLLEVHTAGDPTAPAIVFHHGTPSSVLTWKDWLPNVAARGLFAISSSRAGYGNSDRRAGRSFGDNVSDTADVLDYFGVKDFVSIGWSGGGPHALADTQDSRNRGAISLAGIAPFGDPALDFLAGMGEENEIEFGAAFSRVLPSLQDAWF